jgi:hypothetical protein
MSSGQVVTGLEVGGSLDFELSAGKYFDNMFSAAMMSEFLPPDVIAATTVTLTPDGADNQLATLTITDDFSTISVIAGDVLQLVPTSGSPVNVTVISVTSTTELQVATAADEAAISAVSMDVDRPARLVIGAVQQSYTFGKSYLDVQHLLTTDNHSQTYTGSLVNGFNIDATYGSIVTGAFELLANGAEQEAPSYEQQIVSGGGTVNPAGTEQPLNASIDISLLTSDGVAATYCTESFQLTFTNGMTPTNCLGSAAPEGYTLGTAGIEVNSSIYLSDSSYDIWMSNKLSQTPVAMTFLLSNAAGGWGFQLAQVQLSFPDPSSGGQDTQVMIEGSGTGKVGANGESSLTIYQLKGDQ